MVRSLLTQKQHERANQRNHTHTNSEAIGLDQNVVVDQHDAERCRQHDGERNQENDNSVLHGLSRSRAFVPARAAPVTARLRPVRAVRGRCRFGRMLGAGLARPVANRRRA